MLDEGRNGPEPVVKLDESGRTAKVSLEGAVFAIPAAVLVEMTDEDLDRLAAAPDRDYWRVLNGVVTRILERRLVA